MYPAYLTNPILELKADPALEQEKMSPAKTPPRTSRWTFPAERWLADLLAVQAGAADQGIDPRAQTSQPASPDGGRIAVRIPVNQFRGTGAETSCPCTDSMGCCSWPSAADVRHAGAEATARRLAGGVLEGAIAASFGPLRLDRGGLGLAVPRLPL